MTLDLVVQPIQILVGIALLIWTLGYSALVGLAVGAFLMSTDSQTLMVAGPIQGRLNTRLPHLYLDLVPY
jgi:hypothetical protein